jgi:hypothetical protein
LSFLVDWNYEQKLMSEGVEEERLESSEGSFYRRLAPLRTCLILGDVDHLSTAETIRLSIEMLEMIETKDRLLMKLRDAELV